MTEPGQPCVMISGNGSGCRDFTWMNWMSTQWAARSPNSPAAQ